MGKRVLTTFKKSDRVKDLVARARKTTLERVLDNNEPISDEVPVSLQRFLESIRGKLCENTVKVERGEPLLQDCLNYLSDAQLQQVAEALDPKTKFSYTEERLASIAGIMFKEIGEMEVALSHINHTKNKIILLFIQAFAQEFNKEKSSSLTFDTDIMKKQVDGLVLYRRGLRQSSDNSANASPAEQQAGCCMM